MTEDDIKYLIEWSRFFKTRVEAEVEIRVTHELAQEAADHFERIAYNLMALAQLQEQT